MRANLALGLRLLAAVIAMVACAGTADNAEQAHAGRPTAPIGAQIVGTWRLESTYEENSGGKDIAQFGPAPNCPFMADGVSNFSFQVMNGGAAALGKSRLNTTGMPQATAYFWT